MAEDRGGPDPVGADDRTELRELGRRYSAGPVAWETPPEGLWERIADAAGVEPTGDEATGDTATVRPLSRPDRFQPAAAGRWRRLGLPAAAAVLVVALGVALVVRPTGSGDEVVATGELAPLGSGGSGQVELVRRDGMLQLQIETAGLDRGDGYLEVWVLDPDVTRLVSLGPLRHDGTYDLPPGLDPAAYPVVDVSIEPVDGDPTHSGHSVLRGRLQL